MHNFNKPDRQRLSEETKVETDEGIWFKVLHQVNGTGKAVLWECACLLTSGIFPIFPLDFPWQRFFILLNSGHILWKSDLVAED